MRKLVLTILCSIPLWSATVYKIPPVVVENSSLYCSDYYGENIETILVGDIVDGQIVIDRCGYTKEIAVLKQIKMQAVHDRTNDDMKNYILYTIICIIGCAFLLITVMPFLAIRNDNE